MFLESKRKITIEFTKIFQENDIAFMQTDILNDMYWKSNLRKNELNNNRKIKVTSKSIKR